MENQKPNKFSGRAFTSFSLLFSFILISITGIVLYLAPSGRIAHWTHWTLLALSKEQWQAVHTIFAYLFIILTIVHLFFINWKAFLSYLRSKVNKGIAKKKELLLSTSLTLLIFVAVLFSLPPFRNVMELGEYLTDSWETTETAPPIPHAELLSLKKLSAQLGNVSVEEIENRLRAAHLQYTSTEETLAEIGKVNNITPQEIYRIITAKTSKGGGEKGENGGEGLGLGQKTLQAIAEENGKDINQILGTLRAQGIQAEAGKTLREIADENGKKPREIYDLIQQ